jgi:hypothetical protein
MRSARGRESTLTAAPSVRPLGGLLRMREAEEIMVTEQLVVSVVAAVLALALEVIPGLQKRWETLSWEAKRFAWLVGCLLVGAAPFVLGCVSGRLGIEMGSLSIVEACGVETLAKGVQTAVLAYFASQATHGVVHGVQQLKSTE